MASATARESWFPSFPVRERHSGQGVLTLTSDLCCHRQEMIAPADDEQSVVSAESRANSSQLLRSATTVESAANRSFNNLHQVPTSRCIRSMSLPNLRRSLLL
jgi:hypothetical protein